MICMRPRAPARLTSVFRVLCRVSTYATAYMMSAGTPKESPCAARARASGWPENCHAVTKGRRNLAPQRWSIEVANKVRRDRAEFVAGRDGAVADLGEGEAERDGVVAFSQCAGAGRSCARSRRATGRCGHGHLLGTR